MVLNSQASPPILYRDAGQTSWIDVSAASPAVIPSMVEWAVWEEVKNFSDHLLIVTQLFHQSYKNYCPYYLGLVISGLPRVQPTSFVGYAPLSIRT